MLTTLFDFTDPSAANAWHAIDDRVMGGISPSTLRHDPAGHAVFEGNVSLEQNGGFASVRSNPGEQGLPGAGSFLVELRGENKQFKLSLLTDDGFDSLNYQASFTPKGTDWQTLHLPLADFRASFRGREVTDAPPLAPRTHPPGRLDDRGTPGRALRTPHPPDLPRLTRPGNIERTMGTSGVPATPVIGRTGCRVAANAAELQPENTASADPPAA
ncbi:CIA30 family protein [Roseateles sp. LYH14W]|uniref:CIA30 family protein n=1 Tax=Pelomonas parva TaxID=3299032 RepID=A0ABW7F8H0_9BURK